MKNLLCSLAFLGVSFTTLLAKDGSFTSVIIHEADKPFGLSLSSHQWIKITNFTQNTIDETKPAEASGVAVFQGTGDGLWVLFADGPTTMHVQHEDLFIAGPATIYVPAKSNVTAFLTYLRGSD
ncbi:MAG: hypothetical protein QOJ45_2477 [Verrucomicrobiota bacterium]|jgi:hypothetical protein